MRAAASQTAGMWSWLDERADRHGGRQPVALITHKPVTATETELAARTAPPVLAAVRRGFPSDCGDESEPVREGSFCARCTSPSEHVPLWVPEVGRFITFS